MFEILLGTVTAGAMVYVLEMRKARKELEKYTALSIEEKPGGVVGSERITAGRTVHSNMIPWPSRKGMGELVDEEIERFKQMKANQQKRKGAEHMETECEHVWRLEKVVSEGSGKTFYVSCIHCPKTDFMNEYQFFREHQNFSGWKETRQQVMAADELSKAPCEHTEWRVVLRWFDGFTREDKVKLQCTQCKNEYRETTREQYRQEQQHGAQVPFQDSPLIGDFKNPRPANYCHHRMRYVGWGRPNHDGFAEGPNIEYFTRYLYECRKCGGKQHYSEYKGREFMEPGGGIEEIIKETHRKQMERELQVKTDPAATVSVEVKGHQKLADFLQKPAPAISDMVKGKPLKSVPDQLEVLLQHPDIKTAFIHREGEKLEIKITLNKEGE